MLKKNQERQDFIKMLFDSHEIEINGVEARSEDLALLCEKITNGTENVQAFKQYMRAGQIEKICVQTF